MGLLADGPLFHRVLEQCHVEVATVTPDLSLLDIDGGGEAQCALAAWKGTDTSDAPLLLAMKPLEPVGRTDAHPVRFGEGVELCSRGAKPCSRQRSASGTWPDLDAVVPDGCAVQEPSLVRVIGNGYSSSINKIPP